MSIKSQPARAAKAIGARVPGFTPKVGIILGSGLGSLADHIDDPTIIPYDELPDFGNCTTEGHEGRLVLGYLKGVPVACMQGRAHYYEGITNHVVQTLIRTLKLLGCETLFATNAAGSLREEVGPGSLMLVTDHINFQFNNPLVGANDKEFGPRFISMDRAYDADYQQILRDTAKQLDIKLAEGVYLATLGPSFETPAEIRAFRVLGADAVGMSTIPEVVVARHCGLRVAVVSAITNLAAGMNATDLNHDETLHYGQLVAKDMVRLVEGFVEKIQ
tara:strand:- start:66665 stop:67489 length:825 start_codon:yes stop_codon:yes gene_type:complete